MNFGFDTQEPMANRTSLADIFKGSIGAPKPIGVTQQPSQLFTLLQNLMGVQGQPAEPEQSTPVMGISGPPSFGSPSFGQPPTHNIGGDMSGYTRGMTTLGEIGGQLGAPNKMALRNPFIGMINQKFAR